MKIAAILAAVSTLASAPAAAAVQAQPASTSLMSPWVALSAFGSSTSAAALCGNAAVAAAASAQAGAPGCVLPQVDAAPVPVADGAMPPPAPVAYAPVAAGGAIGFLPILLGLGAVAAGVALLAGKGNGNNAINLPPLSPA